MLFVHTYSEVPNKSVLFFFGIFPTYKALLGRTRLFAFWKSCYLNGFLLIKYQINPTCMPLLGPTRLLISEKPSTYTVIRAARLLETPEYLLPLLTEVCKIVTE